LGKLICQLRVIHEDAHSINIWSAVKRSLAFLWDGLFFGLVGYNSMKQSDLNQRYGDRWAHTVVVKSADAPTIARKGGEIFLLARPSRESLNVRGAFLHVATDLAAFAGTAVAGALVLATGWYRWDPIASLVVAGLIFWSSFSLLRESTRILLEVSPAEPQEVA